MKTYFSYFLIGITFSSTITGSALANTSKAQIGFAHRVNDKNMIQPVLKAGVNGIELDICWGGGLLYKDDWYVSHNDLDVCRNPTAVSLKDWMKELDTQLNNNYYAKQLAAIWIDIKDVEHDKDRIADAVKIIQNVQLNRKLEIIYDLTSFNNYGKEAFNNIQYLLKQNEYVSFCVGMSCGGGVNEVKDIHEFYTKKKFTRGGFNSGDSISIDQSVLSEANNSIYHFSDDPYRLKFIHTWTNKKENTINNYINPNNSYHTDGQIIGQWAMGNGI